MPRLDDPIQSRHFAGRRRRRRRLAGCAPATDANKQKVAISCSKALRPTTDSLDSNLAPCHCGWISAAPTLIRLFFYPLPALPSRMSSQPKGRRRNASNDAEPACVWRHPHCLHKPQPPNSYRAYLQPATCPATSRLLPLTHARSAPRYFSRLTPQKRKSPLIGV